MNDLLLRAIKGEAVERPPVWMMRQAGRTLPEYRAVRAEAGGFKDLLMHPDRAAEVTIQPIDAYGVDAAILFSDILVVPEAMGLPYNLVEKVGPRFPETIRSRADLDRLREVDPGTDLKYVLDAIRVILDHLDGLVPLIGFSGAPWTIFCYMVEGKGSKDWTLARRMLWEDPELSDALLSAITQATKAYLHAQIDAGVHVVQIFDSWAGSLSRELYVQRILPHMHDLLDGLNARVPVTVFAKGGSHFLKDLSTLPCTTLGLDWQTDRRWARALADAAPGGPKVLQGNLDPSVLYANPGIIRAETHRMIDELGIQRTIANLGHGLYPDIPADHGRAFVQAVKEYAPATEQETTTSA
ncbi:MAG: uroporphyrinogen decarboxylase [Bacteroidota bacterium]|nr:uroporphyrinogen decarboxylase [Bacteroidota bacterium]